MSIRYPYAVSYYFSIVQSLCTMHFIIYHTYAIRYIGISVSGRSVVCDRVDPAQGHRPGHQHTRGHH